MIKRIYLFISILIGVWLTGCQDFDVPTTNPVDIDGKTVEVSLATQIPAITVRTRAEASDEEKQLTHVDILVFKLDKTGEETKEKFAYHTQNTNDLSETQAGDENVNIKAKLRISEEDEEYRLVLIANLKKEVAEFLASDNHEGKIKEELIKEITFLQEGKWPTENEGTEGFRALPMWAQTSNPTVITKNTDSNSFGDINFIRSIARIELSVSIGDSQENGSDILEIQEVTVYNARSIGRAVPDAENLQNGRAKLPSLANDGTIEKENMVYEESISDNKISNIYVNETRNHIDGEQTSDALFLIIKAVYKGEDENNTKATYYKIGFYDENNDPVDILRNFTYKMFITDVKGPGEEDEDDAVDSNSSNLTVALTEWSDGEMKFVVFSGKYYLAVSECKLTISKPAYDHSFRVKTNHPDGWKALITEGNSWMSGLTPLSSTKKEESEDLTFSVTENDEGEKREGRIGITAGNLTLDVDVIQTTEIEYSLTILINDPKNDGEFIEFDKTITFHSGVHREIKARELKIIWTPADSVLIVDYNKYFPWGNDTDIEPSYENPDGEVIFKIAPDKLSERAPEDWYPEAVGDIQVQIGQEGLTRENVLIRRRHHEVYIEKADKYVLDGEEHSFKLYSNTKWEAVFEEDNNPVDNINEYLHPIGDWNGDYNLEKEGEDINFELEKVEDKNISDDIRIKIKFLDVDEYVEKEYTFHVYSNDKGNDTRFGEEANCYVLQTGGDKVSIPVSQANRYKEIKDNHIGDNDELKVKFIWTDHENGFDENKVCPVKSAEIDYTDGYGPKARLIVESGNVPGNAVIAVTSSDGKKIHWSWHIWVVNANDDFDPYDEGKEWKGFRYYEFMDRNLGALSAQGDDIESWGLYYQWGRKDPFPAAATPSSLKKRYDEEGNLIEWKRELISSNQQGNNLMASIEDPLIFFYATATSTWFSPYWNAYEHQEFWTIMESSSLSSAQKGIFDPCPEGWKTVPAGSQLESAWNDLPGLVQVENKNNTYYYSTINGNLPSGTGMYVDMGVWPHAGYINGTTGNLTDTQNGSYWTASFNSRERGWRSLYMKEKWGSHPSLEFPQINGLPVRCMRRVDNIR